MSKDIVLTDHIQEKSIPDFEIRNILEKEQGRLFHDRKHDSLARVKNKTVVVFDDRPNEKVVITCYRKNSPTKFSNSRFKEVRTIEV
jgi:hypothetical protein